jgi:hypothetical protein
MPVPAERSNAPNPHEKLVRVFDTEQETEALIVQGLLDSAGIESDLRALDAPQDVFPIGGTVIMVREEDAEQARQIIQQYRDSPLPDDADVEVSEGPATQG